MGLHFISYATCFHHFDCHTGSLDKNAKDVGTGLVGAPACGDVMKLQVRRGCGSMRRSRTHARRYHRSGRAHCRYCCTHHSFAALQIKVGADGKIIDAKFKTFGCGSAIASRCVLRLAGWLLHLRLARADASAAPTPSPPNPSPPSRFPLPLAAAPWRRSGSRAAPWRTCWPSRTPTSPPT